MAIESDQDVDIDRGFDSSDVVVMLKVGRPETPIFVHRNVLCQTSKFMQSKDKPEWADVGGNRTACTMSKTIKLGDHHPNTVGQIFRDLASCYSFGEEMMDISFQNAVIDAMKSLFTKAGFGTGFFISGAKVVNTLYGGTPLGSPGRRFVVDVYVSHASNNDLATNGISSEENLRFDPEFLRDLGMAFITNRKALPNTKFSCSNNYHLK